MLPGLQRFTPLAPKGVKGPSRLISPKSLNFIKGASPDYMHCTLTGVSKLLLNLWLERCHGSAYDIYKEIDSLDSRIAQVQVPSEICHNPRGVSDMKHWKGIIIGINVYSLFKLVL